MQLGPLPSRSYSDRQDKFHVTIIPVAVVVIGIRFVQTIDYVSRNDIVYRTASQATASQHRAVQSCIIDKS